jgi:hypothetical protein
VRKLTRKAMPIILTTLLLLSSTSILLGHAQDEFEYSGSLLVAPNPVGVGQTVSVFGFVQPTIAGVPCRIVVTTEPTHSTLFAYELLTDSKGIVSVNFYLTETGSFGIGLYVYGDEFPSDTVYLTVQTEAVPPAVPVPPGDDVTVHPDPEEPRISLHFEHITSPGTATVSETAAPPSGVAPLSRIIGLYYDFDVTFTFTGSVVVGLPYAEGLRYEQCLSMWHYEGGLVGDVNRDGKVDCRDICLIKLALGTRPGMRRWNPSCDLNGDRRVNSCDLCIALRNYGGTTRTWVDVTSYVDTVNNIVYGITASFPPFGIRYH